MGASTPGSLSRILDDLDAAAAGERVSVADVVAHVGTRSFAPLLLVPALVLVSPLSAIPLVPTTLGLFVALVAAQMLLGQRRLWLPGVLLNRDIRADRFRAAIAALRGPVARVDPWLRVRLTVLTDRPASAVPLMLCLAISLSMPLLEVVPMMTSILAVAVSLFAVGLFVRDGVIVVVGYAAVASGGLLLDEIAEAMG